MDMANATSQRTRKTNTRKASTDAAQGNASAETKVADNISAKTIIPKDIDAHQYVTVRNGFQGRLVYKSRRTGEMFVWDEFGAEQEMELQELKNAKNSYKKFFINNWFMFDEDWIIDYLGVRQFYKHAIPIDGFDNIFAMKPAELKRTVDALSDGQKKSVAYRAKELIAAKRIDSLSVIEVLENALKIELIEK